MKDSKLQNDSEIQKSPVGQKCVPRTESTFVWPHSIQSDLFNFLKEEQKDFVKPVLRVLKKPAQEELCCMLLDYMESGEVIMSNDVVVGGMFNYLTRYNMPETLKPETGSKLDKCIIRPLHFRPKAPMKLGELIDRFFPHLKHSETI